MYKMKKIKMIFHLFWNLLAIIIIVIATINNLSGPKSDILEFVILAMFIIGFPTSIVVSIFFAVFFAVFGEWVKFDINGNIFVVILWMIYYIFGIIQNYILTEKLIPALKK